MESTVRRQLRVLLFKALDGSLDQVQMDRLESILMENPEARERYFELLDLAKSLRDASGVPESKIFNAEDLCAVNEGMLEALAELERTAPTVCAPIAPVASDPIQPKPAPKPNRSVAVHSRSSRFWPGVAKLAIAACITLTLFVWLTPNPPVSTCLVSAAHNAVWQEHSVPLEMGDPMYDQDVPRSLDSGIIKLSFDHRTEAIIEGPATFYSTKANQLILEKGRLCVFGPLPNNGFEVITPYSSVVDLGTEFGVNVDKSGNLVQVFQGEVALKTRTERMKMVAGGARNIHSGSRRITRAFFEDQGFVRYINNHGSFVWRGQDLDLVDVVADGNGFGGGLSDSGISVITGYRGRYEGLGQLHRARPDYVIVPGNGMVDGIFSLSCDKQVISSTGLQWQECPHTTGYLSEGVIRCGARYVGIHSSHIPAHSYRLNGVPYNRTHNRSLAVPANTGITFDLQAIRKSLRGVSMESFEAKCGLSETFFSYRSAMQRGNFTVNEPYADFFVLLDGKIVFAGRDVSPSQGAQQINISLSSKDRFLTLVVAEGRDEQFLYDWALFAEPRIRLQRQ